MALTPQQEHVLRAILRVGRARGASPKEIKAAVETGLVESGLRNLPGGTGDSAGWRQERASLYPDPTNLEASVNRFFDETSKVKGQYSRAGDLAAAVQRPAAQYRGRYQDRSGEASSLLAGTPAASAAKAGGSRTTTRMTPGVDRSDERRALILNWLQTKNQPGSLVQLATGLQGAQDTPGHMAKTTSSGPVAGGSAGARVASGHSPVAASGKVIGTPYTGTHTLGNWQSDRAYDIAVPKGTPMVAVQDGTVVKVTRHPQDGGRFAGDQITVRGANGNEYFYAHGIAGVHPGQRVRRGQKLGVTGSANGVEHLHFGQMKGDPSMHVT